MTKKKKPNLKPPPVLDSARVLQYALVDKSVGYVGRTLLFVAGKELGRVPRMAICENHEMGVLLFHCSRNWKILGCSPHTSVAEAKKKAEWIYPGLSGRWKRAHVTKKQARLFLDKLWGSQRCNFCGKRPDEVEQMYGKSDAYICVACVERFHGVWKESKYHR